MDTNKYILKLCKQAHKASKMAGNYSAASKNKVLSVLSKSLLENSEEIIKANLIDIRNAKKK